MGVIGVAIGVMAERVLSGRDNAGYRIVLAAFAAWLSVVAAASACSLEMAVSGTVAASEVMPAMLGVHALIGLAEAAITAATVAAVYGVMQWAQPHSSLSPPTRFALLLFAVILTGLTPFASSLPDGLSRVTDGLPSIRFSESFEVPSLLAGYALPGIAWPWLATLLAALLGVVLTYWVTTMGAFFCRPGAESSGGQEGSVSSFH